MAHPGGRPSKRVLRQRRMEFVGHLSRGVPPVEAARLSGHSAERALETLSELGFVLTTLAPDREAA